MADGTPRGFVRVGDALEVLATMPTASVDSIVTDPPYGLGFMGKEWDHGVPGVEFWREALRVAKPGAFLAAFGGTRTFHRLACAIEDAGWEIRDTLMWVYGSGFPKSHNGEWGGTALKPAWEPITLARKPVNGTVAANFARYGTGELNIDRCRIDGEKAAGGTFRDMRGGKYGARSAHEASASRRYTGAGGTNFAATPGPRGGDPAGRWPANLVHDGSADVLAAFPVAPGQQGDLTGDEDRKAQVYGKFSGVSAHRARGDSGSAARFFYCAKATRADRNAGCDGMPQAMTLAPSRAENAAGIARGSWPKARENIHPTVKPTDLMRWLCRLVTPAGAMVLDPFTGSGSTGRAAIAEGFQFTGIEICPAYAAIAEARIAAMQPGLTLREARHA